MTARYRTVDRASDAEDDTQQVGLSDYTLAARVEDIAERGREALQGGDNGDA